MTEVQLVDAADALIALAHETLTKVRQNDPNAQYSTVFHTIRELAKEGSLDIQPPAPAGWTSIDTSVED